MNEVTINNTTLELVSEVEERHNPCADLYFVGLTFECNKAKELVLELELLDHTPDEVTLTVVGGGFERVYTLGIICELRDDYLSFLFIDLDVIGGERL